MRTSNKNLTTFCDLGFVICLLYFCIAYSIVALLLLVQSENRDFEKTLFIFSFLPIAPLLILAVVTQKRKSVQVQNGNEIEDQNDDQIEHQSQCSVDIENKSEISIEIDNQLEISVDIEEHQSQNNVVIENQARKNWKKVIQTIIALN